MFLHHADLWLCDLNMYAEKKHLKKQSDSCWNQSLGYSCLVSSKFIVSEIRIAQRPRTKKN